MTKSATKAVNSTKLLYLEGSEAEGEKERQR